MSIRGWNQMPLLTLQVDREAVKLFEEDQADEARDTDEVMTSIDAFIPRTARCCSPRPRPQ
jgi:hypothetical protein